MINIITYLYQLVNINQKPEIISYENPVEAFKDFLFWKFKIDKLMVCLWDYQFPIAHPNSYWALYHLEKENYKLDIKRKPNKHGCFVYSEALKKSNLDNVLNKTLYEKIWRKINSTYQEPILSRYQRGNWC
jgi:hypothetical protein